MLLYIIVLLEDDQLPENNLKGNTFFLQLIYFDTNIIFRLYRLLFLQYVLFGKANDSISIISFLNSMNSMFDFKIQQANKKLKHKCVSTDTNLGEKSAEQRSENDDEGMTLLNSIKFVIFTKPFKS